MARIAAASAAGTAIEFYDFFAYGTAAALVLGPLFFPDASALAGTLAAFGTFAVGFVARPLGSVLFGHIGDRVGRRPVLVGSLLLTGLATTAVGCVPGYAAIGPAAPVLLVALRFLQGLGLGGEWGGAVLLVAEHAPGRRRGLWTSLPQTGPAVGFLLANGIVLALSAGLSDAAFRSWGWRVPFWGRARWRWPDWRCGPRCRRPPRSRRPRGAVTWPGCPSRSCCVSTGAWCCSRRAPWRAATPSSTR